MWKSIVSIDSVLATGNGSYHCYKIPFTDEFYSVGGENHKPTGSVSRPYLECILSSYSVKLAYDG